MLLKKSVIDKHVAESGEMVDIWKWTSEAGSWDKRQEKEDKKVQGISLEMSLFSFSRDSGSFCNL